MKRGWRVPIPIKRTTARREHISRLSTEGNTDVGEAESHCWLGMWEGHFLSHHRTILFEVHVFHVNFGPNQVTGRPPYQYRTGENRDILGIFDLVEHPASFSPLCVCL